MLFTKKMHLNWYFSMKKIRKIQMIFGIENSHLKSTIATFWQTITRWRHKKWQFHFNVCFKKTGTNWSSVSLLCFVTVFMKQTLLQSILGQKPCFLRHIQLAMQKVIFRYVHISSIFYNSEQLLFEKKTAWVLKKQVFWPKKTIYSKETKTHSQMFHDLSLIHLIVR